MGGIAIGTAALVIVLSVFNGLEDLIKSLYSSFDPEIKIESTLGKSFVVDSTFLAGVTSLAGVGAVTEVIEEKALIKYREAQMFARIKGVSENFAEQKRLDQSIILGEFKLKQGNINYAVIGLGVLQTLGISTKNEFTPLQIYYPKDLSSSSLDPSRLYSQKAIMPGGVFAIDRQLDEQYIFAPISFANELFDYGDKRSALELKILANYAVEEIKEGLEIHLGKDFKVLDKDEQHPSLFRAIRIEKFFSWIALSFVLAMFSVSTFFTLNMLVLEKQKDISVLYAMGAPYSLIKRIFLAEGAIILIVGAALGLLLGLILCWLQMTFGFVSMGMETSVVSAYPVKMRFLDFLYTGISVVIITFLASYRPAVLAARTGILANL